MMNGTGKWLAGLAMCGLLGAGCVDRGALMAKEPPRPKSAPAVPKPINEPLNEEGRAKARAEIDAALNSPDPILRANAIEAAQESMGPEAADKIVAALKDASPIV